MEHQLIQQSQRAEPSHLTSQCPAEVVIETLYSSRESAPLSRLLSDHGHDEGQVPRRGLFSGGWRTACAYFTILTAVILFFNLTFTISALIKYGYNHEEWTGTIAKGECDKISRLNTIAHIFINAFSTALLSASNYTMQCVSAPTRREIDDAHNRKRWMDIGVLSLRNLLGIRKIKLLLWCVLAISSVPLHLIYNSAVVATIAIYDYNVWVMGVDYEYENIAGFVPLSNRECIEMYGRQLVDDRKDVIVLVAGGSSPESLSHEGPGEESYAWICNSPDLQSSSPNLCDPSRVLQSSQSWVINGQKALSCLSQEQEERCMLQYSLHLMIAVLVCNSLKLVSIVLVVHLGRDSESDPLVTIGDAIDSFLRSPDKSTTMMSLMPEKGIRSGIWNYMDGESQCRLKYHSIRWFHAPSTGRWTLCYTISLIAVTTAITLFLRGSATLRQYSKDVGESTSFAWSLPLGAVDIRLMFESPFLSGTMSDTLLVSVMTANLPQLIFSSSYLLYNSILTCMLLAKEWDEFSSLYRPLRVTTPDELEKPHDVQEPVTKHTLSRLLHPRIFEKITPSRPTNRQGATYFLQLPYRYSIPLMVTGSLTHWMISQSIFIVRIVVIETLDYRLGSPPYVSDTSTLNIDTWVGWSPIAIIMTIVSWTIMLASGLICGFQRYTGYIPFVGSCSAAISAACHPDPSRPTITTGKVKWGVVWTNPGGVGHCSFSDEDVPLPSLGRSYACEMSRMDNAIRETVQERI